jgi:hypothetical protein
MSRARAASNTSGEPAISCNRAVSPTTLSAACRPRTAPSDARPRCARRTGSSRRAVLANRDSGPAASRARCARSIPARPAARYGEITEFAAFAPNDSTRSAPVAAGEARRAVRLPGAAPSARLRSRGAPAPATIDTLPTSSRSLPTIWPWALACPNREGCTTSPAVRRNDSPWETDAGLYRSLPGARRVPTPPTRRAAGLCWPRRPAATDEPGTPPRRTAPIASCGDASPRATSIPARRARSLPWR